MAGDVFKVRVFPLTKRILIVYGLLISLLSSLCGQNVLIVYYSVRGHTAAMAEAVAAGARSVPGVSVRLLPVDQATNEDVLAADAIILGSPVYNANVAPPIQRFINSWPFVEPDSSGKSGPLRDKLGAAFVTAGGISAGEELAQLNILHSMLIFNMIVVGGPSWYQAFGASGITGEEPFADKGREGAVHPSFLAKGKALGKRVAELAKRLQQAEGGSY